MNRFYPKKNFLQKKYLPKKNLQKKVFVQEIRAPKNVGPKSLVKIGSVTATAEIFLIWTNVARANVAWTNVPVTDGIC